MNAVYFFLMLVLIPLLPAQQSIGAPSVNFRGQAIPSSSLPPVTPPSVNFGMIGITVGQVLRVVATNVGTPPPLASPATIPACGVDVKFFDTNGNQVGTGGHIDSLASGKSFAAEQPGPTAAGRSEYRAQIQIVVPTLASNAGSFPIMVCNIISTIQVYDSATSKNDFVIVGNPISMGFIPGPPLTYAPW